MEIDVVIFSSLALFGTLAVVGSIIYFCIRNRKRYLERMAHNVFRHFGRHSEWVKAKHPTVRFQVSGRSCQLELIDRSPLSPSEQPATVKLTTSWPANNLRLDISPQSAIDRLNVFSRAEDVEIGNWRFDYNYRLLTNSPDRVKDLVSDDVINILRKLNLGASSMNPKHPKLQQITTTRNFFVASVSLSLTPERILHFIHNAVELVGLLSGSTVVPKTRPTASVPDAPASEADFSVTSMLNQVIGAECLVCGDEIKPENMVHCKKCNTPHHHDCWEFVGQCSIYACGSKLIQRQKSPSHRM